MVPQFKLKMNGIEGSMEVPKSVETRKHPCGKAEMMACKKCICVGKVFPAKGEPLTHTRCENAFESHPYIHAREQASQLPTHAFLGLSS